MADSITLVNTSEHVWEELDVEPVVVESDSLDKTEVSILHEHVYTADGFLDLGCETSMSSWSTRPAIYITSSQELRLYDLGDRLSGTTKKPGDFRKASFWLVKRRIGLVKTKTEAQISFIVCITIVVSLRLSFTTNFPCL